MHAYSRKTFSPALSPGFTFSQEDPSTIPSSSLDSFASWKLRLQPYYSICPSWVPIFFPRPFRQKSHWVLQLICCRSLQPAQVTEAGVLQHHTASQAANGWQSPDWSYSGIYHQLPLDIEIFVSQLKWETECAICHQSSDSDQWRLVGTRVHGSSKLCWGKIERQNWGSSVVKHLKGVCMLSGVKILQFKIRLN